MRIPNAGDADVTSHSARGVTLTAEMAMVRTRISIALTALVVVAIVAALFLSRADPAAPSAASPTAARVGELAAPQPSAQLALASSGLDAHAPRDAAANAGSSSASRDEPRAESNSRRAVAPVALELIGSR
ncbi:MAG: hypothetical protein EPO68_13975, partial [Planctomycetota bacterium]